MRVQRSSQAEQGHEILRRIREAIRRVASVLATAIGLETEKDYVVRPWTENENADFENFCASIGETPSDPDHAQAMEDGPVDFFNNDPWFDQELPRA